MKNHHSRRFTDLVPSWMDRFLSDPRSLFWILFILIIIFLFLVISFIVVLAFSSSIGQETGNIGPALLSASGVAVGWMAKKVVDDSQNARTLELALVSDVAAIMTVIVKAGIIQHFILQFANPRERFLWADVARDEDYFSVFDAHVGKLGALRNPKMAAAITRFYTFLKASRDATSPLLGVKKGGGQAAEKPQTEKAAEKEPEDPDAKKQRIAEDHRIRMISVSVCQILETTFKTGIEVIEIFDLSQKDADEKLNGIKEGKELADKMVKHIEDFLKYWYSFWNNNYIEYIKDPKLLDKKINCETSETKIFKDLGMDYFDIEGLRKSKLKPELPDGPSGG